jgi:hypothetical protein
MGRPVALNVIVTTAQERRSVTYGATFLRRDYREAVRRDAQPGLAFALYAGEFSSVRDIERGERVQAGNTGTLDLAQFGRALDYGVELSGLIQAPADDFYQFSVTSDDGAVLEIDGETVVDNDGNHAARLVSGHVPLRAGLHEIRLRYFQSKGGAALDVRWSGASGPMQTIESSFLFH